MQKIPTAPKPIKNQLALYNSLESTYIRLVGYSNYYPCIYIFTNSLALGNILFINLT